MNIYTEKDLADLNKVIQANFIPFVKGTKDLSTAPAYPTDDEIERMEKIRMRRAEQHDENSKRAIMNKWKPFIINDQNGEDGLSEFIPTVDIPSYPTKEGLEIALRARQIQAQMDAEQEAKGLPELKYASYSGDDAKNLQTKYPFIPTSEDGEEDEDESSSEEVEVETFKFKPTGKQSRPDLLKCDYLVLRVGYTDRLIEHFNLIQRDLNGLANKTVKLLGTSEHFNGVDYDITTYRPNVPDKEVLTPLLNVVPTRSIYFQGEAMSFDTAFKIQKIIQDLDHCGGFDAPHKINLFNISEGKVALVMEYDTESG